jgi:hypothetical protein
MGKKVDAWINQLPEAKMEVLVVAPPAMGGSVG